MKTGKKSILVFLCAAVAVLIIPRYGFSLVTSTKYKTLYNEKVALEIEVKQVTRQFRNEKSRLESRVKDLESEVEGLNKKLAGLNRQLDDEKRLCTDRVKDLEQQLDILKNKGSAREKELINENRKMQKRYEDELEKLRDQLKQERNSHIDEINKLKKDYDDRIGDLNKQISDLTDELSELKKLNKKQKEELERMQSQANELENQLQDEIKKGEIRLKRFHNKLIINIDDKISFDSGSADLKKEILPALGKIRKILGDYPEYQIVVEGHTDNIPIKTRRFRDNWQLSTERALSVLRYLLNNTKLEPIRFSAAGYGEYNPIVSNSTAENRSLNRRVDIVVIPRIDKK